MICFYKLVIKKKGVACESSAFFINKDEFNGKSICNAKKINIYVCGCYLSVNFFVNIKAGVMYYIKIVLVFILFLFEGMYGRIMSQVVEYEDYILIVNSYSENSPWICNFTVPIYETLIKEYGELTAYTEHMNMLLIQNEEELSFFEQDLFSRYKHPPRMVILLGNPAFALLLDKLEKTWGRQIPIVLYTNKLYVGPRETYLQERMIMQQEKTPINDVIRLHPQVTVLFIPDYIKETIELMRHLMPDMRHLLFLSDKTFLGLQNLEILENIMQTEYPDICFTILTAGDVTGSVLIDSLKNVDEHTGILLSSWCFKSQQGKYVVQSSDIYQTISSYTSLPIFTLYDMAIDKNGLLGGYFYTSSSIYDIVIKTVRSILEGDVRETVVSPENPGPVLDYQVLVKKGFSPADCPSNTFFYLKPSSFWEQNRLYISVGILLFFFVIFFLLWRIRVLNRQRALQQQMQRLLRTVNCKLSLSLDVANIIPWRWDLHKHLIFCDVKHPDMELKVEHPVLEKQFKVSEEKYFNNIRKSDRDRLRKTCELLVSGKADKVKEEFLIYRGKGDRVRFDWVEVQAVVEKRDEHGQPVILTGSSLLITERKKIEEELLRARDKAEESNRLKSAFLANMSHEIRTPLNAIVGFSQILATTDEEDEKKEFVSIIENNNALLLQLIGDILDLSKIEAGTLEFVRTDVDLDLLMNELERSMRLKVQGTVELRFMDHILNCHLSVDKNRLSQVLINLLGNAAKFTKEGHIYFGYRLQNQDMLEFYVSDTGCGIPREQLHNVFERFVKLNSFVPGTGLGLAICQVIVERLGGKIWVESEEGKGTTFYFTIRYLSCE